MSPSEKPTPPPPHHSHCPRTIQPTKKSAKILKNQHAPIFVDGKVVGFVVSQETKVFRDGAFWPVDLSDEVVRRCALSSSAIEGIPVDVAVVTSPQKVLVLRRARRGKPVYVSRRDPKIKKVRGRRNPADTAGGVPWPC